MRRDISSLVLLIIWKRPIFLAFWSKRQEHVMSAVFLSLTVFFIFLLCRRGLLRLIFIWANGNRSDFFWHFVFVCHVLFFYCVFLAGGVPPTPGRKYIPPSLGRFVLCLFLRIICFGTSCKSFLENTQIAFLTTPSTRIIQVIYQLWRQSFV